MALPEERTYNLEEIGLKGVKLYETMDIDELIENLIASNPTTVEIEEIHNKNVTKLTSIIHLNESFEYEIVKVIGTGSYGCVFLSMNDNNKYAIKEQDYKSNKDTLINILKESIVHYILYTNSPANFPKINQIAWNDDNFYIVMEYLDQAKGVIFDKVYRTILQQKTDAYMEESCRIATTVAKILEPLQKSLEFTHGDLNKGNIYLANDGHIKLLDFGFSAIKFGGERIITSDYNKNYTIGKDLTILSRTLIYNVVNYTYTDVYPQYVLEFFKAVIRMYIKWIDNSGDFYIKIDDSVNNKAGNPENIITKLGTCKPPTTTLGGGRTKVPTARRRIRTLRVSRPQKANTKKLKSRRFTTSRIIDIMQESPEDLIHKNKSKLTVAKLTKVLSSSSLENVKKHASEIAKVYLTEKNDLLSLDLLKTLLYYDDDSLETYCKEYSNLKTLAERLRYVYGTDLPKQSPYIHWNTKDTGIVM